MELDRRIFGLCALSLSACATADDYTPVVQSPAFEPEPVWSVPDSAVQTMRQCIRDGAGRLGRYNYELSLLLEVTDDGHVQAVKSQGADLDDATTQTCIQSSLQGLTVPPYLLRDESNDLVGIRTSPEARKHMAIAWVIPVVKLAPIVINAAGITILIGLGAHVLAMAGTWVKNWGDDPEKRERCKDEWREAREKCFDDIKSAAPPRGITGGYDDIEECARGLVTEDCGGNFIRWGKNPVPGRRSR